VVLAATLVAFRWWTPDLTDGMILLVLAIAVPVILAGGSWRTLPAAMPVAGRAGRVAVKLLGLAAILAVIGLAYWAFPVYRDGQATVLLAMLERVALPLIVLAVAYVWFVDGRLADPHDGCHMAGLAVLGRLDEIDPAVLKNYLLGWVVKAFFAPIMFAAAASDLGWYLSLDFGSGILHDYAWYEALYRGLFFVETLWAGAGYLFTLKLFDAHIRSAEPTVGGWVVCLICYAPFWSLVGREYLAYEDGYYWGNWLADWPAIKLAWAFVILALLAIYVWATFSFGIRFSNLTNRGILTNGPYRWTKHPAYITKNISWWLVAVPFVAHGSLSEALRQTLLLAAVSLIYYARAKTEERHLSRDPAYVAYAAYIAEHGLLARMRQLFSGVPRTG
jgi:protein-S-isoprenylcysteine O-methyltransferase Ste14